mmetsp:Transcript_98316/g.210797  ORF Transcript_98316/g.210797 Transcript_98316/m.210797 type:complete len:450 (-) Transcript_98316:49-1398(-)
MPKAGSDYSSRAVKSERVVPQSVVEARTAVLRALVRLLEKFRPTQSAPRQRRIPDFTPIAHHEAFLSIAYSPPDLRDERQRPDFQPPTDRVFFQMDEVMRHTSADDAWIVVHGNVYNITNFIENHPGWDVGPQVSTVVAILRNLGKDCTLEFDMIHNHHAIRQLAEYRIGELAVGHPSPTVPAHAKGTIFDICGAGLLTFLGWRRSLPRISGCAPMLKDFMSWGSGLLAAFAGGIVLAQLCNAACGLREAVRKDAEASRVLTSRARLTAPPYDGFWGLTASLEVLGQLGAQGHRDACGACVIGKCGLRSGCASFHFSVRDFTGALFGVTACAPDSCIGSVLDTRTSALFSVGGGLLHSADQVNDPSYAYMPCPSELESDVTVVITVDMYKGSISFLATSGAQKIWNQLDILRPEWQPHPGHALFPVIASTYMSLSQFESGAATCQWIAA